ncbi:hypothetical protein JCM19238_3731 [Vibrio ponticus]|nr:hypothetical protein JCM19238_3731 [Vibrio ponticus]
MLVTTKRVIYAMQVEICPSKIEQLTHCLSGVKYRKPDGWLFF